MKLYKCDFCNKVVEDGIHMPQEYFVTIRHYPGISGNHSVDLDICDECRAKLSHIVKDFYIFLST